MILAGLEKLGAVQNRVWRVIREQGLEDDADALRRKDREE
jgi:hypothetical protein